MRAAVLKAFNTPIVIEQRPDLDRSPGSGEVIVDVVATRILNYMGDVLRGDRGYLLETPVVPGAGAIGRVRAVGPDATRLSPGDWVLCDAMVRCRDDVINPDVTLQGLSARGEGGLKLQRYFHDGSWAEQMRLPTENAIAIGDIDPAKAGAWSAMGSYLVPYGGFSAARLTAGETVVVSGATGNFGSAAVAVALAMGAGRVVAAGRSRVRLDELCARFGNRVVGVAMSGDETKDREAMQLAADAPVDCVFDILPPMASAVQARTSIMAVRPYGRVVLMGGVNMQGGAGLELSYAWIMRNCVTIHGVWMYPPSAPAAVAKMMRAGLLPMDGFEVTRFGLDRINDAITHAAINAGPFQRTELWPGLRDQ